MLRAVQATKQVDGRLVWFARLIDASRRRSDPVQRRHDLAALHQSHRKQHMARRWLWFGCVIEGASGAKWHSQAEKWHAPALDGEPSWFGSRLKLAVRGRCRQLLSVEPYEQLDEQASKLDPLADLRDSER